jgi:aconitate hydratase
MLGLTFANESDYDLIQVDDTFHFTDLEIFAPGKHLSLQVIHTNGTEHTITLSHTYNAQQIDWFRAGSALNLISTQKQA